jgi:hypothetical protein
MSLDQIAALAQIAGSVGVVLSLIFVGLQVRQNTAALYRHEHNSTMEQWTVIRMGIAQSRELAEFMTTGLRGESVLDAPDQLRLEQFLAEQLWASFHIWDREQRGVFAKGTHEWSTGDHVRSLLSTPRGAAWWRGTKGSAFFQPHFPPPYVAVVDALLAKPEAMSSVSGSAGPGQTSLSS